MTKSNNESDPPTCVICQYASTRPITPALSTPRSGGWARSTCCDQLMCSQCAEKLAKLVKITGENGGGGFSCPFRKCTSVWNYSRQCLKNSDDANSLASSRQSSNSLLVESRNTSLISSKRALSANVHNQAFATPVDSECTNNQGSNGTGHDDVSSLSEHNTRQPWSKHPDMIANRRNVATRKSCAPIKQSQQNDEYVQQLPSELVTGNLGRHSSSAHLECNKYYHGYQTNYDKHHTCLPARNHCSNTATVERSMISCSRCASSSSSTEQNMVEMTTTMTDYQTTQSSVENNNNNSHNNNNRADIGCRQHTQKDNASAAHHRHPSLNSSSSSSSSNMVKMLRMQYANNPSFTF